MKLSPELSLLVRAALRGSEDMDVLADKSLAMDHEAISELSEWHQVRSLLYDYLETNVVEIPELDISVLKAFSVGEALYNMLFLRKSIDLHRALTEQQVKAFLMKGALWAWLLYEKPGLREFGDIDFFVAKEHVAKGIGILADNGFEADSYRKYLLSDEKVSVLYFETDYQLPLVPVGEDVVKSLEIQWNTTYPRFAYTMTWDELMTKPRLFAVQNESIEIPRIENQLILMVIHHAGVEQWDKLKFMADFVRILRKFSHEMDWQYITNVTQKKGFHRLLMETLGLVRVLTGEDYSQFCGGDAKKQYPSGGLTKQVFDHWENRRPKPTTKSWQIFYFNMVYRDRLSDKLGILFKHIAYLLEWRLLVPKARWYNRK